MNSNFKTRRGARRLKFYTTGPKLELSSRTSGKKHERQPEPVPSTAPSSGSHPRFISFRTRNLPRGISHDAAAGIIDSLCRLHFGHADDVGHLSLSPHPEERFSDTTWDLIWQVYASEIGLRDHLAVIVRHGDGHTRWRDRHGSNEPLVHEHGTLALINQHTLQRTPITDVVQKLEIADAYVEYRWGRPRARSRGVKMKPEQWSRFLEMRRLGKLHRLMDARGEPAPLPEPPDLYQQRRDQRRRRYLADKSVASEIRDKLSDLVLFPPTWDGFRKALAERGLEYRIGVFRPGDPPRYSGRIHMKDDRGARRGVAAPTVRPSLGLDALVTILGPYDPADALNTPVRPSGPRKAPLPALDGVAALPQAMELLANAGFRYEFRSHRSSLGKEIDVGYVRSDRTGRLQRADGGWALSNLKRRFGIDVVDGRRGHSALRRQMPHQSEANIETMIPSLAARPGPEPGLIAQQAEVTPTRLSAEPASRAVVPAALRSYFAAGPQIEQSAAAPTPPATASSPKPEQSDGNPESAQSEGGELRQESPTVTNHPSFSM